MGNYAEWASKVVGLGDEGKLATEEAQRYAKEKGESTSDTAADAVRHMTLAALASRENPLTGEMFMEANEMIFGRSPRANAMDRHNNALGVAKFEELPEEYRETMSDDEVAAYMREIVEEEYQYRKKNDGKPSGKGPKFYEKPLAYAEGGEVPARTSAGRKVFQDEDGENYSEKTITFETKYGWVNMPTVDSEGEQKSQEWLEKFVEENGPVDPVTGATLEVFETVEQAVESAEDTTAKYAGEMSQEFNEGGLMAGDKMVPYQTKDGWVDVPESIVNAPADIDAFLMDEGSVDPITGAEVDEAVSEAAVEPEQVVVTEEQVLETPEVTDVADDEELLMLNCGGGIMSGAPVDPISGNPIPPGSTAENVRDDIPAMLSEGEYVMPADVVKYHGLKTIMAMRAEAKAGLMAMEMEGQIKSVEQEGLDEANEALEGVEVEEVEVVEESGEDAHGNEDYPTEDGQFAGVEGEELLVIMANDGGVVEGEEEEVSDVGEEIPKMRMVRRMRRNPETGLMEIYFINVDTGQEVSRGDAQAAIDAGTGYTLDQSPRRQFEEATGRTIDEQDDETEEETEEEETTADSVLNDSDSSENDYVAPEPVERTADNNYGYASEDEALLAQGIAGILPIPFAGPLMRAGTLANNTAAVNAYREEMGLEPVDTTLGINLDAGLGKAIEDYDVGPFSADVYMEDVYGRVDPDQSKLSKFFGGLKTENSKGIVDGVKDKFNALTGGSRTGLPYDTSSYLTPQEIAEKQAAGLSQGTDGRWSYSDAAEQAGLQALSGRDVEDYGTGLGADTAREYGLSAATTRGQEEAAGLAAQDAELFDDNDDGVLDADERAAMEDFYNDDDPSGGSNTYYATDRDEATAGASSDWNSPGAGGGYTGGNYDSNSDSGGGTSGNGSDPGDGGGAISSTADGNDFDNFNKGGYTYRPKQKFATIKKK